MKHHILTFLAIALLAFTTRADAQHTHMYVGIVGNQLQFVQGYNASTVRNMMPRPVGQRYGGYYTLDEQVRVLNAGDYFTLAVYSDGQTQADPANHPLTGADIWVEITDVVGPPGAHFGYWEGEWPTDENGDTPQGRSYSSTTPTKSLATNQPTGGYRFELSDPLPWIAAADQDPFGHVHSRGFTVDKPGDYTVSLRLYDQSLIHQNGSGPHTPSPTYVFRFRAGPDFQPVSQFTPDTGTVLTWPSLMGIASNQTGIPFTVKRSFTLATGSWQTLGIVTGTTAATATFTDSGAIGQPKAFYRLEYQWRSP